VKQREISMMGAIACAVAGAGSALLGWEAWSVVAVVLTLLELAAVRSEVER
jgi:hypothetical protein